MKKGLKVTNSPYCIEALLVLGEKRLEEKKISFAKRSCEEILSELTALSLGDLYLYRDKVVSEDIANLFFSLIEKRALHMPVPYILQKKEFFHCTLYLDNNVLIPREETEYLVEKVVSYLQQKESLLVWDLCCGSGCIGIALKKALPKHRLLLSDICPNALKVAKKNACQNGVDIEIVQEDFLENEKREFDLLICNPPYIAEKDFLTLEPEVKNFEPKKALIAENKGLIYYEKIAIYLKKRKLQKKTLFLEMGYDQADKVREIFSYHLGLQGEILLDLSGVKRFFFLEIE